MLREFDVELRVLRCVPYRAAFARTFPRVSVGKALLLRAQQRVYLDQDSLPFVSLAGAAEANDDGPEYGISGRTPCEGGVSRRDEDEVSQVRAHHVERALAFKRSQLPLPSSAPHSVQAESRTIWKTTMVALLSRTVGFAMRY